MHTLLSGATAPSTTIPSVAGVWSVLLARGRRRRYADDRYVEASRIILTAGRAPHLVGFHCGVDVEVVSVDGQGNPLHGELFVASNTAHPTDIDPRLQRGELPSSKKEIEPADFTLSDQIWTIETDPHLAAIEPEGTTVAYGPAKERDLEDKFQGVGGSTADR